MLAIPFSRGISKPKAYLEALANLCQSNDFVRESLFRARSKIWNALYEKNFSCEILVKKDEKTIILVTFSLSIVVLEVA